MTSAGEVAVLLQQLLENPHILGEPSHQQALYETLSRLYESEQAWRICVSQLVSGDSTVINHEQLLYLYLQVIEHHVRFRYQPNVTNNVINCTGDREILHNFLTHCANSSELLCSKVFILNKLAGILAQVFVVDYLQHWPSLIRSLFLERLRTLLPNNSSFNQVERMKFIDFYLRALIVVDDEIADRDFKRTRLEEEQNNKLKDAMRERVVNDVVCSWYAILVEQLDSGQPLSSDAARVVQHCLNAVGSYVAWIDIQLIVNEQMMPLVMRCIAVEETREEAIDAVCSILEKKIEATERKLELLSTVDRYLAQANVFAVVRTMKNAAESDDDPDALAKLSEVVGVFGSELVNIWNKLVKQHHSPSSKTAVAVVPGSILAEVLTAIEQKLELAVPLLSYIEDNVSQAVIEFIQLYINIYKNFTVDVQQRHEQVVVQTLMGILSKYRFPIDYNHEVEGDNEAAYQEYRKQLKTVYTLIAATAPDMTLRVVGDLIEKTLVNWKSSNLSYADVEIALRLLYNLGEAIPTTHGQHFTSNNPNAQRLKYLVELMVTCGVSSHKHVAVQLQFFENAIRFEKVFALSPQLVGDTVLAFVDERGMRHPSSTVRSRTSYLFARFVKSLKTQLNSSVPTLLGQVAPLLNSEPLQPDTFLTANDKLFLYESVGVLIVSSSYERDKKQQYMHELLADLSTKFAAAQTVLSAASLTDEQRQSVIEYLNNVMAYASRASKAFSSQHSMTTCGCSSIFLKLLQGFAAASLLHRALLPGYRQYLHRMVLCLPPEELMTELTSILPRLTAVASMDPRDLQDFLALLQQIVIKYKADAVNLLGSPDVVGIIHTRVTSSVIEDPSDEEALRSIQLLWRAYFQFLNAATNNHCLALIAHLEYREHVFNSLVVGACNFSDSISVRLSFQVVARLLETCQSQDPAAVVLLCGFAREKIIRSCMKVLLETNVDLSDAQNVLAVNELANLIRRVYERQNDETRGFLHNLISVELQAGDMDAASFCSVIGDGSTESKSFQKFLKNFILKLYSSRKSNR